MRGLTDAELAGFWDTLAAEDAARAGEALARLAAAPEAVPFLKTKLQPAVGQVSKLAATLEEAAQLASRRGVGTARRRGCESYPGNPGARRRGCAPDTASPRSLAA